MAHSPSSLHFTSLPCVICFVIFFFTQKTISFSSLCSILPMASGRRSSLECRLRVHSSLDASGYSWLACILPSARTNVCAVPVRYGRCGRITVSTASHLAQSRGTGRTVMWRRDTDRRTQEAMPMMCKSKKFILVYGPENRLILYIYKKGRRFTPGITKRCTFPISGRISWSYQRCTFPISGRIS